MASFIDVPATANRFNEGQATVRDYLEIANSANVSFAGSWTIEAWVATTDDDAQFKVARCYLALGEKDKAQAAFEKLLEEYPESEYVERSRKELRYLRGP